MVDDFQNLSQDFYVCKTSKTIRVGPRGTLFFPVAFNGLETNLEVYSCAVTSCLGEGALFSLVVKTLSMCRDVTLP